MLFETLLTLLSFGICLFLIVLPAIKMVKSLLPKKTDSLAEARERLEKAKMEAEAARLNKEAERLYTQMYQEALEESEDSEKGHNKR